MRYIDTPSQKCRQHSDCTGLFIKDVSIFGDTLPMTPQSETCSSAISSAFSYARYLWYLEGVQIRRALPIWKNSTGIQSKLQAVSLIGNFL